MRKLWGLLVGLSARAWSLLDHFGRAYMAWVLGGAWVVTGLGTWALTAADGMPTAVRLMLIVGLFFLSFATLGVAVPHVVNRIPTASPRAVAVVPTATQPPQEHSAPRDAPRPMSPLEATLARNNERVVRANIQAVLNELAAAKETIDAAEEEGWWLEAIRTVTWDSVCNDLAPERGIHHAFNATRDAYRAITKAEEIAESHRREPRATPQWEEHRLRAAVAAIDTAERSLNMYLTDLANS